MVAFFSLALERESILITDRGHAEEVIGALFEGVAQTDEDLHRAVDVLFDHVDAIVDIVPAVEITGSLDDLDDALRAMELAEAQSEVTAALLIRDKPDAHIREIHSIRIGDEEVFGHDVHAVAITVGFIALVSRTDADLPVVDGISFRSRHPES